MLTCLLINLCFVYFVCLFLSFFEASLSEDETCPSVSGLYMKFDVFNTWNLFVFSVQLFIISRTAYEYYKD